MAKPRNAKLGLQVGPGPIKVKVDIWQPCPACAGKVGFVTEPMAAVAHTMPYCKDFEALDDIEDLIAFARRSQAKN